MQSGCRFPRTALAGVVLWMTALHPSLARAEPLAQTRIEDGGRSFAISAPGLTVFRAGFAANVELDGVIRKLDSTAGKVVETKTATESGAYGSTMVTTSVIRFEEERLELLFRLGTVADTPHVVLVQAGIRNFGEQPVRLAELVPMMMDHAPVIGKAVGEARLLQTTGKPEDWLLTGLNAKTSALLVLGEMQTASWIHEQGAFYRRDGAGFLFGPVGDPVSYVSTLVSSQGEGGPE